MKRKLALAALALMAVVASGAVAIAVHVVQHWDEPCIGTAEFHPPGTFTCLIKALRALVSVPERTLESGSYRELAIGMTRAEAIEAVRKLGARSVSGQPRRSPFIHTAHELPPLDAALRLDRLEIDGAITVFFSGNRVLEIFQPAPGHEPIPGLHQGQWQNEALAVIASYLKTRPDSRVGPFPFWVSFDAGLEHDLDRSDTWEFSLREPRAISVVTIEFSADHVARIHVVEWPVELS